MKTKASIHRMVTPRHLCPWGVKALDLLKRHGYAVDDHHLTSEEENEQYKKEHHVDETPQIDIGGEHIGGYDALRKHLGLPPDPKEGQTYQPIIAVFSITLLMAFAQSWAAYHTIAPGHLAVVFVTFSMCVLGILKLRDLQSFATGFVQYDLLARRYVPYASVYAFIETLGGVSMLANVLTWLAAPIVLTASTVGAVSVFKAVYIEKRDLNCACVGGGSKVPLGFISLTENLMMMAMSLWMLIR